MFKIKQRYNVNEEKKLINNGKEAIAKDLKHYITEITNEYKREKELLKKELNQLSKSVSSKEREERLKLGKERLHTEANAKEEAKRKQLDRQLADDLFIQKRKHLLQNHRQKYDHSCSEINEQKAVLVKNHQLHDKHLNLIYALKQRHLAVLQKRKAEFMEKEISEEILNSNNYCERRKRDLKKKHAIETKQHPKNLKQQQANIRKLFKHQYNTQNKQYKTYKEQVMSQTPKDQIKEKLQQIKDEQNRKFSLLYEHYKTNVDAVYQQQNLKLTESQQLEQDQLNDDLERQISVLNKSHLLRKQHQAETFARENEALESERIQKKKDLDAKIQYDTLELDKCSKQRLTELTLDQQNELKRFDTDFMERCLTLVTQNKNRHSVYNLDTYSSSSSGSNNQLNHRSSSSASSNFGGMLNSHSSSIHKKAPHLAYFGDIINSGELLNSPVFKNNQADSASQSPSKPLKYLFYLK